MLSPATRVAPRRTRYDLPVKKVAIGIALAVIVVLLVALLAAHPPKNERTTREHDQVSASKNEPGLRGAPVSTHDSSSPLLLSTRQGLLSPNIDKQIDAIVELKRRVRAGEIGLDVVISHYLSTTLDGKQLRKQVKDQLYELIQERKARLPKHMSLVLDYLQEPDPKDRIRALELVLLLDTLDSIHLNRVQRLLRELPTDHNLYKAIAHVCRGEGWLPICDAMIAWHIRSCDSDAKKTLVLYSCTSTLDELIEWRAMMHSMGADAVQPLLNATLAFTQALAPEKSNNDPREWMIRTLLEFEPTPTDAIATLITRGEYQIVAYAVHWCGAYGLRCKDEKILDALCHAFDSRPLMIKRKIPLALASFGERADSILAPLLSYKDREIQKNAATALIGRPNPPPDLVTFLTRWLDDEDTDCNDVYRLGNAIEDTNWTFDASSVLPIMLRSPHRREFSPRFFRDLLKLRDKNLLDDFIQDKNPEVRLFVLETLTSLRRDELSEKQRTLITQYLDDSHWHVRTVAASLLAGSGNSRTSEILCRTLRDHCLDRDWSCDHHTEDYPLARIVLVGIIQEHEGARSAAEDLVTFFFNQKEEKGTARLAAMALSAVLGDDLEEVVTWLAPDHPRHQLATWTLYEAQDRALPALAARLAPTTPRDERITCLALVRSIVGNRPSDQLLAGHHVLLGLLNDSDPELRVCAATGLLCTPKRREALAVIGDALTSDDPAITKLAAESLTQLQELDVADDEAAIYLAHKNHSHPATRSLIVAFDRKRRLR